MKIFFAAQILQNSSAHILAGSPDPSRVAVFCLSSSRSFDPGPDRSKLLNYYQNVTRFWTVLAAGNDV